MMSVFTEFIDADNPYSGTYIIAFPYYIPETRETVVIIRSIFDDSLFIEINEGFRPILGGINRMLFLSRNELYIDYEVEISNDAFISRQIIVLFDYEGNDSSIITLGGLISSCNVTQPQSVEGGRLRLRGMRVLTQ